MKRLDLPLPLFGFAAATRVALGAGIGLLASSALRPRMRRRVGGTLVALGALTTIPIALLAFRRREEGAPQPTAAGAAPLHQP